MKIIFLLVSLLLSANVYAFQDDWNETDKNLFLANTVLIAADWATTRDLVRRRNENYYEYNPVLGRYPSIDKVDTYFVSALVGHYLLADSLSSDDRRTFFVSIGVLQSFVVARNLKIGLHIRF